MGSGTFLKPLLVIATSTNARAGFEELKTKHPLWVWENINGHDMGNFHTCNGNINDESQQVHSVSKKTKQYTKIFPNHLLNVFIY